MSPQLQRVDDDSHVRNAAFTYAATSPRAVLSVHAKLTVAEVSNCRSCEMQSSPYRFCPR